MTVTECSLMSFMRTHFRIGSHTMTGPQQSAHSNFIGSRVHAHIGVTCHLHFWLNDWGLLHATAVTQGWNGHRIRVRTQSWLWRRKVSCRLCQALNSQPFDHESGALPTSYPGCPLINNFCSLCQQLLNDTFVTTLSQHLCYDSFKTLLFKLFLNSFGITL